MAGEAGSGRFMSDAKPIVSVVIPNLNGMKWLPGCLEALQRQDFTDFEIIVIDNGSTDDSCAWLIANAPAVRIINMGYNAGFAAAVNTGIKATCSPFVALLNNDTEAAPGWLSTLLRILQNAAPSTSGVCGKMIMMEDRARIENAGDTLAWNGAAEKRGFGQSSSRFERPEEIFSPCAGGVLFRKSFLESIGLFDESFFAYLEDIDLGLRGRLLGYNYLYEPSAILAHQGHGSNIPSAFYVRLTSANRLRLFLKNIPARLILKHLPSILYGQFYFFFMQRRPIAFFMGYLDVALDWRSIRKKRAQILAQTKLDARQIDQLLLRRMQQSGILRAIWLRLTRP